MIKPLAFCLTGLLCGSTLAATPCAERELLLMRDQIVMARGGTQTFTDIFVLRADGSQAKRLTKGGLARHRHDNTDAAWSPDGQNIVFVSNRVDDENPELYRMKADGSGVQRLTKSKGYDEYPDWSNKGRIIFSSNRAGADFQLFSSDTGGGKLRQLTKSENKDFDARWSPDGKQFVFTRERDGGYRIYLGRADDRSIRALTPAWMNASEASWGPDGKRLIFSGDGHQPGSGHLELFRMDVTDTDGDGIGDNLTRLTDTDPSFENMEPEISKDGECILFVSTERGSQDASQVLFIEANGGEPQLIGDGFGARWR